MSLFFGTQLVNFSSFMKLYLHNILQDSFDGKIFYPLKIEIDPEDPPKDVDVEFDLPLMQSIARKIDYVGLESACQDLKRDIPHVEDIENPTEDELLQLHKLLFGIEIPSGFLVSESGKRFEIIQGIPNMCPEAPKEEEEDGEETE